MNAIAQKNKKVLFWLGVAETIIGVIFLIIQIVSVVISAASGSGVITGFLAVACIILGGSLGIASGTQSGSPSMINAHMTFAIIGSIICLVDFIVGAFGAAVIFSYGIGGRSQIAAISALLIIVLILALTCAVLFIVSASYCCKTTSSLGYGGCCGGCGEPAVPMTYAVQTHQIQPGQGVVFNGQPNMALSGVNYAQPASTYEAQTPNFEPLPNKL